MTDEQLREIVAYYASGVEVGRLSSGRGRLEFARTQEIVSRFLPPPPAVVVDVGGATGAHAEWLAADGYAVHLIDPVPLHVEHARALAARFDGRMTATLGEARRLPVVDASADVVLLFGPLYHLPERADRVGAWREAHRVLRPGGLVLGVGVSIFAAMLDRLFNPDISRPGFVRTAYFHHPDELGEEAEAADLQFLEVLGVEGPGWLLPDFDRDWEVPERRTRILEVARASGPEPALRGVHAHLVAAARRA